MNTKQSCASLIYACVCMCVCVCVCYSGAFALWLDDCLYRGRTDQCETFDNDPLTDTHDFVIDCLEAWSFQ